MIAPFPDRCLLVPFSHDFAQYLSLGIVRNDIQVTPKIIYENSVGKPM